MVDSVSPFRNVAPLPYRVVMSFSHDDSGELWQLEAQIPHLPLSQATFVVLDLETTGASPSVGAGITEIGAIKVQGGEVKGEFSTFVNPQTTIPSYITELTGITNEMVVDAPVIGEALPEFIRFLGDPDEVMLVAHNSPFDMGFLQASADAHDIAWPDFRVIDTVKFARLVIARDEILNYKLGTLAAFFETEQSPTHRALDDVRTTVELLHRLLERAGSYEITTVEGLSTFLRRSAGRRSSR